MSCRLRVDFAPKKASKKIPPNFQPFPPHRLTHHANANPSTMSSTVFCENAVVLKKSSETFPLTTSIQDVVMHFRSQLVSDSLLTKGYFTFNSGKPITKTALEESLSDYTDDGSHLRLRWNMKLCGGKGGFGSMLRAQGGKMSKRKGKKKENDTDSYRNLEGQRMKNVRKAKELAAYIDKKQSAKDSEYESKKEKLEAKILRKLNKGTKFDDTTHTETLESLTEEVQQSIRSAYEKELSSSAGSSSSMSSSSSQKSFEHTDDKAKEAPKKQYKGLDFFGEEEDDDSSSDSDSE